MIAVLILIPIAIAMLTTIVVLHRIVRLEDKHTEWLSLEERVVQLEHFAQEQRAAVRDRTAPATSPLFNARMTDAGPVPVALIVVDAYGRIIQWGPGATVIFQFTDAEVLGRLIEDVVIPPGATRLMHAAAIKRIQEGHRPKMLGKAVALEGITKGGELVPITLTLEGWRDPIAHAWYFGAMIVRRQGTP